MFGDTVVACLLATTMAFGLSAGMSEIAVSTLSVLAGRAAASAQRMSLPLSILGRPAKPEVTWAHGTHVRVRASRRSRLRRKQAYGFPARRKAWQAGRVSIYSRCVSADVRGPALDDAPVRRVRHRPGVQPALPRADRGGQHRALGRLR